MVPMEPMESLTSPVASERETQQQTHGVTGPPDAGTVMSDPRGEASPLPSDPDDTPLLCSSPPIQDTGRAASAAFSPPAGSHITLPGPESSVPQTTAPQPCTGPQVQYQVPPVQLQVSQALFAQTQVQIQSSVPQPLPQVQASVSHPQVNLQAQPSVSQLPVSVHTSVRSPLHVSVSVPQQQPDPTAASVSLSKGGEDSTVQQHTQNSEFHLLLCKTHHSNMTENEVLFFHLFSLLIAVTFHHRCKRC